MNRIRSMTMVLAAGWLCLGAANAQTAANLTIVSGDGQIVCPLCTQNVSVFYQPMVVEATDSSGNPVAGVAVTWTIAATTFPGIFFQSGSGTYSTFTDSNGLASATFNLLSPQPGSPLYSVEADTVTAATANQSVTFYVNQALQDQAAPGLSPITAAIYNSSLNPGQTFSGQVGSTGSTPIQIRVSDQSGSAVPNVAVFLVDAEANSGSPTIQCAGSGSFGPNMVVTDANGIGTCNPVYGGSPGSGLFWLDVGGAQSNTTQTTPPNFPASEYFIFPATFYNAVTGQVGGYTYNVTPGAPGNTSAVSGSGQSAQAGQALTQPLVAKVLNATGQPLAGVTVNWTVSPANAASLASTSVTGSNGQTSNNVTLSNAATGTVTVTAVAAGSSTKATFTITVTPTVTITGFSIVSGNNQSTVVGTAFAQPLVVQVSVSGGSAAGIPVQFRVQSGSVTVSSSTATTGSNGQAQVTVQAGSSPGGATVLASVSSSGAGSTQTFNLTVVQQAPVINITAGNFYNAADLQPNSLSPCSLGMLLSSSSLGLNNVQPLFPGLPIAPPTSAAVTISFNSISAPILNIGNNALGQQFVMFQVPCTVSPAAAVPTVVTVNGSSATVNLNVQAASPGVFRTVMSDGVTRALLVRPDGSFVSLTNPARRGETEVAFVTGLGPTSPAIGTGGLPVPLGSPSAVLGTVVPGMNGGGLPLIYAQLSEDLPGVYLVAFQIPSSEIQGNNVPFSIGVIPVGSSTAFYSALTTVPVQ